MYKSLLEILNDKQIDLLRRHMWWAADTDKPYLLKFAHDGDFALLQLTDLKSLWVARLSKKALLEDKVKYAKSLEIKESKDLMALFNSLLSASDSDALYQFKEGAHGQMQFTFKKRIEIYDFSWVFKLQRVSCNPVELVCRELLSPLASVLQAQVKRIQILKKRFEQVQKDYLRKMTEMERGLYKSPLLQDQDDWAKLLPSFDGRLLHLSIPDTVSEFLFSCYTLSEKPVEKQPIPMYSQHKSRAMNHIPDRERYELADSLLSEQIEADRQKQRKEKKIDFI